MQKKKVNMSTRSYSSIDEFENQLTRPELFEQKYK